MTTQRPTSALPGQRQGAAESRAATPPVLIKASAGTGKTFQLSNRYLKLMFQGQEPERILATTFTRKAAGEILARILYRLAEAAQGNRSADRLAAELNMPGLNVEDCRRSLHRLTRNLHRVRISTLDSFFLQATQTLSLELGLPPDWQIADETDERTLRELAVQSMLLRDDPTTVIQLLNWLAKGATHRSVNQLLMDTVDTMYSLYLESPGEAWRRLPRLKGRTPDELRQIDEQLQTWLSTTDEGPRLRKAVASVRDAMADAQWEEMTNKGIVKKLIEGDPTYFRKDLPEDLVRIVSEVVEHIRAELQNRIALQTEASYELLRRFDREYQTLKLDRRAMRFDDLARRLASHDEAPDLDRLNYRLDATIDGLMLDEFQDTSLDQWLVIRPIAQHTMTDETPRSFFCVGDVKQAIYGWRGGNAELMDAVLDEFDQLTCATLDQSFRSAPAVIEIVNRINQHMDRHDNLGTSEPAVAEWVRRFPAHSTSRTGLPGYVCLETTDEANSQVAGPELAIKLAADRVDELRRAAPERSVAVLVRTNQRVGEVMYQLQKRGILASEEGGNPLTNSAGVQLVVSLLQLSDYPQDTAARFHLAQSPWAPTLGLLDHTDEQAAVRLSDGVRRRLADVGYGETVDEWVRQLQPFSNPREWRRLNQLAELAHRYQQQIESPRDVGYNRQHGMPIATNEFIRRVQQQRISDPTEDPVRVMTVHQAKGLQFDAVVLPDLDRNVLPRAPSYAVDRASATEPIRTVVRYASKEVRPLLPQEIQQVYDRYQAVRVREELSVFYVAMTRAVHALYMIIAPSTRSGKPDRDGEAPAKGAESALPRTVAGLIRATLTDRQTLEPRDVVVENGDRDWWQSASSSPVDTRCRARETRLNVVLRPPKSHESGRFEPTVRPSKMEGDGRVRLADRLALPALEAMQRGSLIHRFFEHVEWIDDGDPSLTMLGNIGRLSWPELEEQDDVIDSFRRMLESKAIRDVLSLNRYRSWVQGSTDQVRIRAQLDVRREQRLSVHESDRWIIGNIDRLVIHRPRGIPVAAEILDFKTDAMGETSLTEAAAGHRPQLLAYRRGVSRMLDIDVEKIRTTLVFVGTGDVVDVTPTS